RLAVCVIVGREGPQRRRQWSFARAGHEVLVRSVAVRVGGRSDARHDGNGEKRQHPHEDQFPHISLLGTVHGLANPLTSVICQSSNGFPPTRAAEIAPYGTKRPWRMKVVSSPSPQLEGQPVPKPVPFGPGSSTR